LESPKHALFNHTISFLLRFHPAIHLAEVLGAV
jgi:hypothetical protein